MRGRQKFHVFVDYPEGTTPAHAGKTVAGMGSRHRVAGPPPRMRGRRTRCWPYPAGVWTTPAHAGKTLIQSRRSTCDRDHPRACGEDLRSKYDEERVAGPPPRMRGRPAGGSYHGVIDGTTPAHAGKTNKSSPFSFSITDHPRACGEDRMMILHYPMDQGPPPRMRGRPLQGLTGEPNQGTTPAHAGKTVQ